MIIFQLPETHPFIQNLNDMIKWVKSSDVPNSISGDPSKEDLTEKGLNDRMNNNSINGCRTARFDRHKGFDFTKIDNNAKEIYEEKTGNNAEQFPVAKTWYPPNGYIGWHIDQDGDRLYATFAEGKSFFRYKDSKNEIITSWDIPNQWIFRLFNFDKNNPMWHCVKAYDLRISVGYRFVKI